MYPDYVILNINTVLTVGSLGKILLNEADMAATAAPL